MLHGLCYISYYKEAFISTHNEVSFQNLLMMSQTGKLGICIYRCSVPPNQAAGQFLRNRLVGDIPNPRMIANFVVRLSVVLIRWSQSHIIKKPGRADPESIHFCPSLLITTFTILSAAVWRLPALSSDHRRRTAPRSVWPSAAPAFPVLLPGSLCRLPFSEQSAVHIPAGVL